MRRPALRITLRQWMTALAVSTVLGAAVLRPMLRPYPTIGVYNGGINWVWSDGSTTAYRDLRDVPFGKVTRLGPMIVRVAWKDGSSSFHLRHTPRRALGPVRSEPPLGIPPVQNVRF